MTYLCQNSCGVHETARDFESIWYLFVVGNHDIKLQNEKRPGNFYVIKCRWAERFFASVPLVTHTTQREFATHTYIKCLKNWTQSKTLSPVFQTFPFSSLLIWKRLWIPCRSAVQHYIYERVPNSTQKWVTNSKYPRDECCEALHVWASHELYTGMSHELQIPTH